MTNFKVITLPAKEGVLDLKGAVDNGKCDDHGRGAASTGRLLALGHKPRMICREAAAAYCGVSPAHFDEHVKVDPVMLGRRKVWDLRALDCWLDARSGFAAPLTSNKKWLEALDGDPVERG